MQSLELTPVGEAIEKEHLPLQSSCLETPVGATETSSERKFEEEVETEEEEDDCDPLPVEDDLPIDQEEEEEDSDLGRLTLETPESSSQESFLISSMFCESFQSLSAANEQRISEDPKSHIELRIVESSDEEEPSEFDKLMNTSLNDTLDVNYLSSEHMRQDCSQLLKGIGLETPPSSRNNSVGSHKSPSLKDLNILDRASSKDYLGWGEVKNEDR